MATVNSQPSVANFDSDDEFFCASEEFDCAQDSSNFASIIQGKISSHPETTKTLRINVNSDYDLHERYMSSEEEPSPSPDSENVSQYGEDEVEEPLSISREIFNDKENEEPLDAILEVAIPEIALAVPIMSIGRPKLIDITNLAPMHKRKRANTDKTTFSRAAMFHAASRTSGRAVEREILQSVETTPEKCEDEDANLAGQPSFSTSNQNFDGEDVERASEEIQESETHEVTAHDPSEPRLMPRDSMNVLRKKQGSVARARRQISRSASRDSLPLSNERPMNKRVRRMQARGADERLTVPFIPAYPEDAPEN